MTPVRQQVTNACSEGAKKAGTLCRGLAEQENDTPVFSGLSEDLPVDFIMPKGRGIANERAERRRFFKGQEKKKKLVKMTDLDDILEET